MQEIRLALVGFGNVAQGFTQILAEHEEEYARKFDLRFLIVAIADPVRGSLLDPDGVDLGALLQASSQPGGINSLPGEHPDWDALQMIQSAPADALVELSFTNLTTGEPATTYLTEALRRNMNVITTNKGPIALHYDQLAALARLQDLHIGVEGTVMSGTPVLRVGRRLLSNAGIERIQGILNGTTNFILTQMETGQSYTQALQQAQAMGYAEADPAGDVEGFDAAAKVAILARLVLGENLPLAQIERTGITAITLEQVQAAAAAGNRWKLIGSLSYENGKFKGRVRPECLPISHPLAQVSGATNAICYSTHLLGDVTIIGPGAGRLQTGYAVLQDLIAFYCPECIG